MCAKLSTGTDLNAITKSTPSFTKTEAMSLLFGKTKTTSVILSSSPVFLFSFNNFSNSVGDKVCLMQFSRSMQSPSDPSKS